MMEALKKLPRRKKSPLIEVVTPVMMPKANVAAESITT